MLFLLCRGLMTLILSSGSPYQLRLYCTSSSFYSPHMHTRQNRTLCPIELPPISQVCLNNVPPDGDIRHLHTKLGTAVPVELHYRRIRMNAGSPNNMVFRYMNTEHGAQPKVSAHQFSNDHSTCLFSLASSVTMLAFIS